MLMYNHKYGRYGNRSHATEINNSNYTYKYFLMKPINVTEANSFIFGPHELFCDV